MAAASTFQEEVCISDLTTDCRVLTESAPPYRIVHVNAAWCQTTGYTSQALVGSTCGVLQGADTCRRTLQVPHAHTLPSPLFRDALVVAMWASLRDVDGLIVACGLPSSPPRDMSGAA